MSEIQENSERGDNTGNNSSEQLLKIAEELGAKQYFYTEQGRNLD